MRRTSLLETLTQTRSAPRD